MDFELLGSLGWREGLIAIIALLVGYVVLLFLRLRRLQRERSAAATVVAQSAIASYAAIQEPPPAVPDAVPETAAPESVPEPVAPVDEELAWSGTPPENPGQALLDSLQQEVYQLRCEVDELRAEVLAAREDIRHQLVQSADAAPAPTPQYADAMQMAGQGHDATAIAHHCRISRAEADLVVALARNRKDGRPEGGRG
ncbi:MAG TPA: DUF2802 domain-containing protein [Accumulibacter sp.]|jgi:hypothetical protein|nr:DUF2802 domain-containing protein [Accumulibacter sp.]HQC79097.1 DUF2802 domain-containing protein [Accumulibacter sp.]